MFRLDCFLKVLNYVVSGSHCVPASKCYGIPPSDAGGQRRVRDMSSSNGITCQVMPSGRLYVASHAQVKLSGPLYMKSPAK
jgi:hypothetical protein